MKSIFFKEIKSFFGSLVGYLVIAIFLLINSLFLWVFEGDFNILNSGYADLNPFFSLAPWVLLFLIPAVTMRSFSDEKKQGTLELLMTKPISISELVVGKFLGAAFLIFLAIVPTFLYVWIIYSNGLPHGSIDLGYTIACFFGLFFLIFAYTAIGIYASTLSENQIVAFIIAVFLCFIFYIGFEELATKVGILSDYVDSIGISAHYRSIGRGVIDSRDILYFLSLIIIFLVATILNLKSEKL